LKLPVDNLVKVCQSSYIVGVVEHFSSSFPPVISFFKNPIFDTRSITKDSFHLIKIFNCFNDFTLQSIFKETNLDVKEEAYSADHSYSQAETEKAHHKRPHAHHDERCRSHFTVVIEIVIRLERKIIIIYE